MLRFARFSALLSALLVSSGILGVTVPVRSRLMPTSGDALPGGQPNGGLGGHVGLSRVNESLDRPPHSTADPVAIPPRGGRRAIESTPVPSSSSVGDSRTLRNRTWRRRTETGSLGRGCRDSRRRAGIGPRRGRASPEVPPSCRGRHCAGSHQESYSSFRRRCLSRLAIVVRVDHVLGDAGVVDVHVNAAVSSCAGRRAAESRSRSERQR